MCHHHRVSDWFKRLVAHFSERAQPVWEDDAEFATIKAPVKVKAPRKTKAKKSNKKTKI